MEGPLAAAKVGEAQRGIGGHHAHQRHIGEIVALGDHLSPDQDLGLPPSEGGEDLLIGVPMGHRVRVHAHRPRAREPFLYLLLHLLRAHAEVLDEGLAAVGAYGGHGLARAAVVTADRVLSLMVGHGDVAVVAGQHVPAGPAGDEGGVPPPVQKQHGLVSLLQARLQLGKEQGGEDAVVAVQKLRPHVRNHNRGQGSAAHPVLELDELVAAVEGPIIAQQGGGGAAQQEPAPAHPDPPPGDVQGVVAGRDLALVAGFVFLVDDDEPQVFHWREHGAAGADDDGRLA